MPKDAKMFPILLLSKTMRNDLLPYDHDLMAIQKNLKSFDEIV